MLTFCVITGTAWLGVFAAGAERGSTTLPEVQFENDATNTTTEGHLTLSWKLADQAAAPEAASANQTEEGNQQKTGQLAFELQQAPTPQFEQPKEVYRGRDLASFRSGLPEGETYFRVRTVGEAGEAGGWSEPIVVVVDYPSKSKVIWLMVVGSIVFVMTVGAIAKGYLDHQKGTS